MKFRLGTNFPATARGLRRRIITDIGSAALRTSDEWAVNSRNQIQGAMKAAKLGKLSGAVRYSSDYRRKRRLLATTQGFPQQPWRAGGIVYTTGGSDRTSGAFKAYSQGAVIVPKAGRRWLAFPTSNIPKRAGRKKMTPALYNKNGFAQSIGPLTFVPGISPNVAYLVVKNVSVSRLTGGRARRLGSRGGVGGGRKLSQFTVAFILIRTTTRARRFDPLVIMNRQFNQVPARLAAYLRGDARGGAVSGPVLFSSSGTATGIFLPTTRV